MTVRVKFWGVRGSVPSPITAVDVEQKVRFALDNYYETLRSAGGDITADQYIEELKRSQPFTYGGNTSCVEIRDGDGNIFVLDMGTGLRPFGNSLIPEIVDKKGVEVFFIGSHVHGDHIQGFPFFGPLFFSKEKGFRNTWHFIGGTQWHKTLETCLRGQMDPPTFPVSWKLIEQITHRMTFGSVHDGRTIRMKVGPRLTFGMLDHPQETYGVRLEFPNGPVIAYTTDNEARDPQFPTPTLVALAKDADVWITDCQYTRDQYNGIEGGIPRHGWGHSYPESVAPTLL